MILISEVCGTSYFYPRPPRGGRRQGIRGSCVNFIISIHALREEGDGGQLPCCTRISISIHALREEGDEAGKAHWCRQKNFYPRPPRGGRRLRSGSLNERRTFLSTPSARRATILLDKAQGFVHISIHALREEGDAERLVRPEIPAQFLSTPSARRATQYGWTSSEP